MVRSNGLPPSHDDVELRQFQNTSQPPNWDDEEDDNEEDVLNDDPQLRRASVQSFELYTPDEEKAVVRKLDIYVVAFMSFLYLLSFLDRTSTKRACTYIRHVADTLRYWQCASSRNAGRSQAAGNTV